MTATRRAPPERGVAVRIGKERERDGVINALR